MQEILIRYESWTASDYVAFFSVLFTGVIGAFSLILSFISLAQNKRLSKENVYIDTITSSRIKWLDNLKDLIAQLLALRSEYTRILSCHDEKKEQIVSELFIRLNSLCGQVEVELNYKGKIEKNILIIVSTEKLILTGLICNEIGPDNRKNVKDVSNDRLFNTTELLSLYCRIYTKTEWQRIDFECKNRFKKEFKFEEEFKKRIEEKEIADKLNELLKKTSVYLHKL